MSDFFNSPKVATKEHCKSRWSCGKPGEFFRCGFCGHKFVVGDWFMVLYTNDMSEAPGNPLVCKSCYNEPAASGHNPGESLRERWAAKWRVARSEYWWFIKHL